MFWINVCDHGGAKSPESPNFPVILSKENTYPLSFCRDVDHLLDTLETGFLIGIEREVEKAAKPTGKLGQIVARLAACEVDDLVKDG